MMKIKKKNPKPSHHSQPNLPERLKNILFTLQTPLVILLIIKIYLPFSILPFLCQCNKATIKYASIARLKIATEVYLI